MDISDTLAPASEQLDAIELIGGPRVFIIERITRGSAEQPINVHLVGFPRPWRPGKSMRRVLAAGWGTDSSRWAGRSVELYMDPTVTFGKERPGGTRIKAMSDLPGGKRLDVHLLVSRGRSALYTVAPLPDDASRAATRDWRAEADALTDDVALRALWRDAPTEARDYIADRAQSLTAGPNVTAPAPTLAEPEGWEK